MISKNNRAPLLCYFKLVHHFVVICKFKLGLQSGKAQIGAKFALTSVTLTHCLRDKIGTILQTTLSNTISLMKILIKISQKFVPKGPIINTPALVQIMAWHRPGDKSLSGPMLGKSWRIYASLGLNELTFDIWPWPFGWTSLLSMVMVISWWYDKKLSRWRPQPIWVLRAPAKSGIFTFHCGILWFYWTCTSM